MKTLKGKTAIITGASSGIGRRLAVDMAVEGVRVALVARSEAGLQETAGLVGEYSDYLVSPCDVGDLGAVKAMADHVHAHLGDVDILVNNAGFARHHTVLEASIEEYEALMRTNYMGTVHCTTTLLPEMIEHGEGHIVNVSSIAGRIGTYKHAGYSASKFAVTGFSECLYYDLKGTGVGVTIVNPGVFETRLFDDASFDAFRGSLNAMMRSPAELTPAIIRAIRKGRFEVTVPRFMWLGVVIKAVMPSIFRWMQGRFLRKTGWKGH